MPPSLELSYVLPFRREEGESLGDLGDYLHELSDHVEVVVVDGSPAGLFRAHRQILGSGARHLRPDPGLRFLNGKVTGVTTGVRAASHDRVVVADDDVRYDLEGLCEMDRLLAGGDAVVPQNYFDPLPWHARWDTARSLINRALGRDYPGTLGVRRSTFLRMNGYDGGVLFENLELMRSVAAAGGRVLRAPGVFVRRLPPTARRFWSQRVRQAYDDFAIPGRMAVSLAVLPSMREAAGRWGAVPLALAAAASVGLAEVGRRRHGGRTVFPASASLLAPLWVLERATCAWLALGSLLVRRGCRYRGGVIRKAGNSMRALRRVERDAAGSLGPGADELVSPIAPRLDR